MPYTFNPFTGTFDDTVPLTNGQISSDLLPSYVDDVLEYADFASFPAIGETGKIYVAIDAGTTYRWSGSAYVAIGGTVNNIDDLADVDTSTVAPADGQSLIWDDGTSQWRPADIVQPTEGIGGLGDVDTVTTPPVDGKLLKYKNATSKWEPQDLALDELTDVDVEAEHPAPLDEGRALIYVNGKWQAGPVVGGYQYNTGDDPLAANVIFGTSYDTDYLDESGYFDQVTSVLTVTTSGTQSISAAAAKYGAAGLSNSWSSYIEYSSSTNPTAFVLGTGDFCIEGWFDDNRGYGARGLFYFGGFDLIINASGNLVARDITGSASQAFPSTHTHVAVTRENGFMRVFQNGILVLSGANANNYTSSTTRIGYANPASPYYWQGYIDDLRFTKGVARYTTNFTPPTGAILGEDVISTYSIDKLDDVDTSTTSPTDSQALVWNNTAGQWEPGTVVQSEPTGITGASAITNCVQISQANYDAIGTPDANTLYVIV